MPAVVSHGSTDFRLDPAKTPSSHFSSSCASIFARQKVLSSRLQAMFPLSARVTTFPHQIRTRVSCCTRASAVFVFFESQGDCHDMRLSA